MATQQELKTKLRKLGQKHKEIDRELNHYLEDMNYKPSYAFNKLLGDIRRGKGYLFDPNSNEAKDLRKLAIEIGMYRQGEAEVSTHKKYSFKLDDQKYMHNKKLSKVVD